jgi:hypothetical protein
VTLLLLKLDLTQTLCLVPSSLLSLPGAPRSIFPNLLAMLCVRRGDVEDDGGPG